jgi:hypothetical protein
MLFLGVGVELKVVRHARWILRVVKHGGKMWWMEQCRLEQFDTELQPMAISVNGVSISTE